MDDSSFVVGSSAFVDSSIPGVVVVGSECVVDERAIEDGVVVGAVVVCSSDVLGDSGSSDTKKHRVSDTIMLCFPDCQITLNLDNRNQSCCYL